MIDRLFVETKLSYIQKYYEELEGVLGYSNREIQGDVIKLRALERVFQLIVDEMIDINNHIIRYAHLDVPDDFQSGFLVLAERGILPKEFAEKIAPVVGLRNRLVHRYEKVDVNILLSSLRTNKSDIRIYAGHIFNFLDSNQRG
jgi:uncharacterized protein YutE (UPF0331/DUF86 family)